LPAGHLAGLLFGFNLGVEIGQLTLVFSVLGLTALVMRSRLRVPRWLVADLSAALLTGVGLFWFVSRSYA